MWLEILDNFFSVSMVFLGYEIIKKYQEVNSSLNQIVDFKF